MEDPVAAVPLYVDALVPTSYYQEGATVSVLDELLHNIQQATEQATTAIYQSLGSQVAAAADGALDADTLSAMAAVADIPGGAAAGAAQQHLAQYAQRYREVSATLEALTGQLRAAQAAADLEATQREFQAALDNGQYEGAAYTMVQLRKVMEEGAAGGGSDHMPDLAAAYQQCEAALSTALWGAVQEAFSLEQGSACATLASTAAGGCDLKDLWAAAGVAGTLEAHVKHVADSIMYYIMPSVLSGAAVLSAHATPAGDSAIVQWSSTPTTDQGRSAYIEQGVTQLLQVLAGVLFRGEDAVCVAFGAAFWAPFVQAYEASFLEQAQHISSGLLHERQEAVKGLEAAAVQLGFIPAGSDLAALLSRAVLQSCHVHTQQYLARVRELIASHDWHQPPVAVGAPLPLDAAFYQRWRSGQVKAWELLDPPSGWDTAGPVLAAGYYQVTPTVVAVAAVIDDALADACASKDPHVMQAAKLVVPQICALYSTLTDAPSASDAPQLALLFHNDLQYLGRHLLLLPYLFSPHLEEAAGEEVWFGQEAQRLRAAARACFNDALAVQQAALREPLSLLKDLHSLSSAAHKHHAHHHGSSGSSGAAGGHGSALDHTPQGRAREQLLHTLKRAGGLVWPTLLPGQALDFSARLMGPVYQALLGEVLARKDIGERECQEIVELYQPLVDRGVRELLDRVDVSGQNSVLGEGEIKEVLAAAVRARTWGLRKLGAVLGLMTARLADVVARWRDGSLLREGLSLGEVEKLVMALFEDTDYRAQCLQKMQAADVQLGRR